MLKQSMHLDYTDGHSTEDIVYQWLPGETEVLVGNKEMAQFEYKGSKLSSEMEIFTKGYQ